MVELLKLLLFSRPLFQVWGDTSELWSHLLQHKNMQVMKASESFWLLKWICKSLCVPISFGAKCYDWIQPIFYRTKLPTLNPKKKSEWEKIEDESNSNGAGSNLGQELLCTKLSQKLSTGKHSEKGLKSLSASGVQIFLRVVPQHHFLPLEGKGFMSVQI